VTRALAPPTLHSLFSFPATARVAASAVCRLNVRRSAATAPPRAANEGKAEVPVEVKVG
jgi:hypothetical protein